jgi:hypothetical protein
VTRLVMPWLERADWAALRLVAVDRDDLEVAYEDWLRLTEASCAELARDGVAVERVAIDATQLIDWCRACNLALDANARSCFAALTLRRRGATPAPMKLAA